MVCTPDEATEWYRQIGTVTADVDRHAHLNLSYVSSDFDEPGDSVSPQCGQSQGARAEDGKQEVDQVIWERFRQSIRVDPISLADRRAVTTDAARSLGNLPSNSHYLNIQNIPSKTYVDNTPPDEVSTSAPPGSEAKRAGGGGVQGLKEKRDQVRAHPT